MSQLTRNNRFPEAKLVLCIDVGTTFTAASYCIVHNKNTPSFFQEVNRWPKQVVSNAKIPSAIFYDSRGQAQLHGAETDDTECLFKAEEEGWLRAEWWKLHLRPDYLPLPDGFTTKPLPPSVTVDKAFEDLFAYVLKNVQAFIIKTLGDIKFWSPLSSAMFVVLTTLNGWEGHQQNRMRNAAVNAGLISTTTKDRLRFVSEGEAAVHYCLDRVPVHSLKVGHIVLVCDAGGGTTDIGQVLGFLAFLSRELILSYMPKTHSVYKIIRLEPLFLEEILSPRCIVTGGVYVNFAAKKIIKDRLKGSPWDTNDSVSRVLSVFEKQGKRAFTGAEEFVYLVLSESGQSDPSRGIVRGRFKFTKQEMINLFEPSLNRLTEGLGEVFMDSPYTINQVFVVGGFAESDYVYSKIAHFVHSHYGVPVAKPDGALSKAIAHGGLSWHFESSVQVRMTRLHYGAETDLPFEPGNSERAGREKYKNRRGEWRVRNAFKCIVPKSTRIRTKKEHRESFHRDASDTDRLDVELELYAYRLETPPQFFEDKDGNLVDGFVHLGTVKGDLAKCYHALQTTTTRGKKSFKTLEYDVGLTFSDIELSAALHWKENGSSVRGQAVIAYDM